MLHVVAKKNFQKWKSAGSLSHLANKHLLNSFYELEIVLGAEYIKENKKIMASKGLQF